MSQLPLQEAYARLIGFKQNIPTHLSSVPESYIDEYHAILDILSKAADTDLKGFYVPRSAIVPVVRSINTRTHTRTYSSGSYCDRAILMMKVDAIITFFSLSSNDPEKPAIGFKAPS